MPKVQLPQAVVNDLLALDPKIKPNGGFQRLAIELREKLDTTTNSLELSDNEVEKIRRYRTEYGGGGWQNLYNAVLKQLD